MKLAYRSIEGLITDGAADCLFSLACEVPEGGLIVNVGTWKGKSVACFIAGQPKARIVTIDVDHSRADPIPGVVYITDDSGKVALGWDKGKEIDLLFIDGSHSYEGVMGDTVFANYVKVGGIVAFHDYDDLKHACTYAIDDWWMNRRDAFRKIERVEYVIVYERTK